MILVDTSVWIRFLAGRAPFAMELDRLLDEGEAAAHDLIHGELMIGDRGGRVELLRHYGMMHRIATVPHVEVAGFVQAHKLYGR